MSQGDLCIRERYLKAKRALFDKYYRTLNDKQRQAVYTVNNPLLVLAGAGSGKTTVLVKRIAFIIKYGNAYYSDAVPSNISENMVSELESAASLSDEDIEQILPEFICDPCPPWAVLAITFTNKAANEMKTRLSATFDDETIASDIWAGTFHSVCVRILRRYGELAGYKPGFTIYDMDDAKKLICECMKKLNIDDKILPPKSVMNTISRTKDKLMDADGLMKEAGMDLKKQHIAKVYAEYQKRLRDNNALDFDDIIMQTVHILTEHAEVRDYYQNRFKYVCVDEYQDTNFAQFRLTELLSGKYKNIMVVGDDDQSIYKFRGATIENILGFDHTYPDAKVIKLEQNYRSTQNILNAANSVIRNNFGRRGKDLWTECAEGDKLCLRQLADQTEEARYIINKIMDTVIREKRKYRDFAVLYRVNAQAGVLENVFAKSGVPYRVLGGVRFFDHKEIRDVMAYLHVISNPSDNLRLMRIINEPKRKIGTTTVEALESLANEENRSMFDIMKHADKYLILSKSASKLGEFVRLIESLSQMQGTHTLHDLVNSMLDMSGYRQMLIDGGEEAADRLDNVNEFVSTVIEFERNNEEPTLQGFLEELSLVADVDRYDENANAVVLMTVHSAKGLEFPMVFLPGMEDGIFPGLQSSMNPEELEEERRLAYVALTRAKERIYITHVTERVMYGKTQRNPLTRFIREIPEELLDTEQQEVKPDRTEINTYESSKKKKVKISDEFFRKSDLSSNVGRTVSYDRFTEGDAVSHITFGRGVVMSVKEMGADILYEVAFDSVGTKKLMATYAKLRREEA